jgi:hypothetical protein
MVGVVFFFILLASALHYSGTWYSQYLPMSDSNTYDNTGKQYDVSRILSADYTLDVEAYNNYSPLFLRYTPPFCPSKSPLTDQHNVRHRLRPFFCCHRLSGCVHLLAPRQDHLEAVQEQHNGETRHPHEVNEAIQRSTDLVVHVAVLCGGLYTFQSRSICVCSHTP